MDNKWRRARIVRWENDGEYISVWYTNKDGERVSGMYERFGWNQAPSGVVAKVMKALSRGPRHVVGSRGHPQPSSPQEPQTPPQQQDP